MKKIMAFPQGTHSLARETSKYINIYNANKPLWYLMRALTNIQSSSLFRPICTELDPETNFTHWFWACHFWSEASKALAQPSSFFSPLEMTEGPYVAMAETQFESSLWQMKSFHGARSPGQLPNSHQVFCKQEINFAGRTAEITGSICYHNEAYSILYFRL